MTKLVILCIFAYFKSGLALVLRVLKRVEKALIKHGHNQGIAGI